MIQAIQTTYQGYKFRSRLEARWAVFFDALGLKWEYEPEGFDLGGAGWYLPDFLLPDMDGGNGMWVEVKPEGSTEFLKIKTLARHAGRMGLFLDGVPAPRTYQTFNHKTDGDGSYYDDRAMFNPKYLPGGINGDEMRLWMDGGSCGTPEETAWMWACGDDRHGGRATRAVNAARAARFENGS